MDKSQARIHLRQWIATHGIWGDAEFDDQDDLVENGIIDSLAIMMLLLEIESMVGRSLSGAHLSLDNLKTIEAIIDSFFREAAE